MNILRSSVIGILLAVAFPLSSQASNSAVQRYMQVKGPFATAEEAEMACMQAVGFTTESIRLYTGNIGNLWKVENPLRFLVRRCLNNIKKQEENRIIGERREGRNAERIQRKTVPRTQSQIRREEELQQSRTRQNMRSRSSQHTRTAEQNTSSFAEIRSARRVEMRAQERNIRSKLDKKEQFQKEAELECRNQRGAQRVMCIRNEVREREEALYNE